MPELEQEIKDKEEQVQIDTLINHSKAERSDNDELVQFILDKIDKDSLALKPKKDKFVEWNDLYKGYQADKNYQGLANLFIPEILKATETLVSMIHSAIFDNPNYVKYVGMERHDRESAENMTTLVLYQTGENKFEIGMSEFIRQMCTFGTGFRKILWEFMVKQTRTRKKNPDTGKIEVSNSEEIVSDNCWNY